MKYVIFSCMNVVMVFNKCENCVHLLGYFVCKSFYFFVIVGLILPPCKRAFTVAHQFKLYTNVYPWCFMSSIPCLHSV